MFESPVYTRCTSVLSILTLANLVSRPTSITHECYAPIKAGMEIAVRHHTGLSSTNRSCIVVPTGHDA